MGGRNPACLQRIEQQSWLRAAARPCLHPGSLVVADNVKFPGAPEYQAYMRAQEGRALRTDEHRTHVEYRSLLEDIELVSERLA